MEKITYSDEEITETKKKIIRTIVGYRMFCDECGKEFTDGEKYCLVDSDSWDDYGNGDKIMCTDCTEKEFRKLMSYEISGMNADIRKFDSSSRIGNQSVCEESLYRLMKGVGDKYGKEN